MKVLVVGGSGVIGSRLVPLLLQRRHEVVATTRTPDKVERLRALGAHPVVLDALDAAAVGEAVARAAPDAVIHQVTALSGKADLRHFDRWFAETNRLRTAGTANLLAAAQGAGARRIVVQSYTGWTHAREGALVKTEDDPCDPEPLPAQRETLAAIRELESMVRKAPMEGIVLRYANLYGPGASDQLVGPLRKRQFPIVGDGSGVWSWLHVDDAATATVAALERAEPGIYQIADDDPAPVREWLPALAAAVGAPGPIRVPVWLARLLAGDVPVRMMTESRGVSNAKAKAALSWRPHWASWRDGFRTLAPQPRERDRESEDARIHAAG